MNSNKLRWGYTEGPHTWLRPCIVAYPNGNRKEITVEDGFTKDGNFPDTAHANFLIDHRTWPPFYDRTDDGPEAHVIRIERLNEFMDRADAHLSKFKAYKVL